MYLFTPPDRLGRTGSTHPLFGRLSLKHGVSLLKESGVYRQTESPTAEEVAAADVAYIGGHSYEVSDAEATALTSAGYGEWLYYSDTAFSGSSYGVGDYGE